MIKKVGFLFVGIALMFAGCAAPGGDQSSTNDNSEPSTDGTSETISDQLDIPESNTVIIRVADHGDITLQLDPSQAPVTVANFKKLVTQKFYDGLTFHRIIKGFMIQGGDPKADGTGGAPEQIKGEFKSNGVDNNIRHERGVISMARSGEPNSASSQFFICDADAPHLDGDYAAFGKVVSGLEVVDSIAATPTSGPNGTVDKSAQPIIEMIYID